MSSDTELIDLQKDAYPGIVGSRTVETTKAKTHLAFVREDLFPNMPLVGWKEAIAGVGEKIENFLGLVAAPSNIKGEEVVDTKKLSISLPHYGRADFIPMVFAAADGTVFSGLYRKVVGGTRNLLKGDFNAELHPEKPGRAGLSYGDRSQAENQMSNELHELGVRIRLPILGLYVDEVKTMAGDKGIEDLVREGILKADYLEKRPLIVFYARRNPYTFADAVDYIKEGGNPQELLRSQAQYLKQENDDEAKRVADLIEKGDEGAMRAWFGWMAKTFGQQMVLWAKIGFIHPSFHGQNMSLAIETGDTGDLVDKFKLIPILDVKDEKTLVDFADQGFSALYFLNGLLKDMGEEKLEKDVIENFVMGMMEPEDESREVLVGQMLKMLKENGGDDEYLTKCLEGKL